MDRALKKRVTLRRNFNFNYEELLAELAKEVVDLPTVKVIFNLLESDYSKLSDVDERVSDLLDAANSDEEAYLAEHLTVKVFDQKFMAISIQVNDKLKPPEGESRAPAKSDKDHKFKLPKIELKKFTGEIKEWIGFWAQFEKINDDPKLHQSDKFQYLLQSTVEGSRARELVESYPQSGENYPKVIEALRERFGNKELLAEVYVRELLKLVFANVQARGKLPISKIYDQLESKIRALESLKVTGGDVWLYPLVESCLSDDLLRVWQRDRKADSREKLKDLMDFLKMEVMNEEKILIAREGFDNLSMKKPASKREHSSKEDVPTVAGLTTQVESKSSCVFCCKGHESKECYTARKLTFEEKKAKLIAARCCFYCFGRSHVAKFCKVKINCAICCKRHYPVMCPDLKAKGEDSSSSVHQVKPGGAKDTVMSNQLTRSTETILLQTVKVRLIGADGKTKIIRLVFDSAAMRTCALQKTIEEFDFEHLGSEQVVHTVFGGSRTEEKTLHRYRIRLESMDGKFRCNFQALNQTPKICGSIPEVQRGPWFQELRQKKIWLSDVGDGSPEIEVLVGADIYGKFLTGRIRHLNCGLTAVETYLGWTVFGKAPQVKGLSSSLAMPVTTMLISEFSVPDLWELEAIGIKDPSESKTRQQLEEDAKVHFLKTVKQLSDGRYEVHLPWTTETDDLGDNRIIAEKRLRSATMKLKSQFMYEDYQRIFEEWKREGIIEEVKEKVNPRCHYLPHRPVVKMDSLTTKIRPVFDASCKSKGQLSLNDCLEKGPNILELIPSVLLRFREGRIGVISDIKKAFLQISIAEQDRDFLRFLWWEGEEQLKIYRHARVVFGVNCSPYLLGAVIEYHLSRVAAEEKNMAEKLWRSLYVDNCVTSVDTVEDLIQFKSFAVTALAAAQMDLRMWECSAGVPGISSSIDDGRGLGTGWNEDNSGSVASSVLGLIWMKDGDTLKIKLEKTVAPEVLTKRFILSAVQSIFDPLGFVSPVTLVPKLLLQQAWNLKLGWDAYLPDDCAKEFRKWLAGIQKIGEIAIPRRMSFLRREESSWTLHTFCDASKDAYAAVIFLRCEYEGRVTVQLLQSKSRVSPLKVTTIPRLELLACLIGVRLTKAVTVALDLNVQHYFWSDSATALAWIKRMDNWGVFVSNRVKEIRALSREEDWRHVPGKFNPADLPSRGCNAEEILKLKWWEGPSWLKLSQKNWPVECASFDEEQVNAEKRKTVVAVNIILEEEQHWFLRRFSSYQKVVRLMAWILRVKSRVKSPELTVEELGKAEMKLLKLVQHHSKMTKDSYPNLRLFLDKEGLFRLETKISRREDFMDFRQPIVLPKDDRLVELIIIETHEKNGHAGVQIVMQLLREKFWIVQSRRMVKKVVSKCIRCRRYSSKNLETVTPSLPVERVQDAAVFQVTGADLAGPLYLKGGEKSWIVLFTCAVYRAVHLELITSLSTEAFLQAFRRFVSRRGRPSIMWTDCGTNFQGAANLLNGLDWKEIEADCQVDRIQWKFNPAASPWWGGWWERLIRVVKSLLLRILGKAVLGYEELSTVLCGVESIVNARPMTYLSEDPDDLVVLAPEMFLKDIKTSVVPDLDELDSTSLQKRIRYRQKLRDEFKMRFRNEYLSQLVQKAKERKPGSVKLGDIVLIGSDDKKKIQWPMGRIVELYPGADGVTRVVKLRTMNGFLVRPMQRIYPLEVELSSDDVIIDVPIAGSGAADDIVSLSPESVPVVDSAVDTAKVPIVKTRSGRVVKLPVRFGI